MPTTDELQAQIDSLQKVIAVFEKREWDKRKKKYDDAYNTLRQAILTTSEIENVIENTYEKLGITDLMADLIIINNPYSDKLGFKFIDVLESKIESILLKGFKDDTPNGKKNRFLRIIRKVINNPIADIILKSNPVGAVVSNVVNTASNFIDTTWKKVEGTKLGKGLKKIAITTKDEISNTKLKRFQKEIQKYADFYSGMLKATQQFDTRIDILKNTFDGVYLMHKNYKGKYLSILGISGKDAFKKLDGLFEQSKSSGNKFDFSSIVQKKEIVAGLKFVATLTDSQADAERYANEFSKTLRDFITQYVEILHIPIKDKWTTDEIDTSELRKVIKKLNDYLKANTQEKAIASYDKVDKSIKMVTFSENIKSYVA